MNKSYDYEVDKGMPYAPKEYKSKMIINATPFNIMDKLEELRKTDCLLCVNLNPKYESKIVQKNEELFEVRVDKNILEELLSDGYVLIETTKTPILSYHVNKNITKMSDNFRDILKNMHKNTIGSELDTYL